MKIFKKFITLIFITLIVNVNSPASAEITLPAKPTPAKFVNDFTGKALTSEQTSQLNQKLENYSAQTTNQIVVVIVKSTGDYEIADYSFELGRTWGIGQKGKNNGVLITWATDDRKVFIATGYGVEGELTDALSKRIIEQLILPQFKQGNFYGGLDAGTNQIMNLLSPELKMDNNLESQEEQSKGSMIPIIFLIIWLIFFFISPRSMLLGSALGAMGSGRSFGGGRGGSSFGGGSFSGGGAGGSY